MSTRTGRNETEPLFLDEPADMPPNRKRPGVSIEELFGDEASLSAVNRGATAQRRSAWGSKASTFVALFLLAALIGFSAASFWLL